MSQSKAYLKMMLAQSILNNDPTMQCLDVAGAFIDKQNHIEYRHTRPSILTRFIHKVLYKQMWFNL